MAPKPSVWRRPSEFNGRSGLCEPKDANAYIKHLKGMNMLSQWSLTPPITRQGPDLPLYDRIEYDAEGNLVLPPDNVRLSDALVFLILARNNPVARYRSVRWPADFNSEGDIYPDRWPAGNTVVVWAFGLPFIPVYADYYVLTGVHIRHYGWILNKKTQHKTLPYKGFHFGQIVVSPHEQTVADGIQIDYDDKEHQAFELNLTFASTDYVLFHTNDAFTLTRLPNFVGFHPNSGQKALLVMDCPDSVDNEIWEQRKLAPYCRATNLAMADENDALLVPARLRRKPADTSMWIQETPDDSERSSANADTQEAHEKHSPTTIDSAQTAKPNSTKSRSVETYSRATKWKSPTTAIRGQDLLACPAPGKSVDKSGIYMPVVLETDTIISIYVGLSMAIRVRVIRHKSLSPCSHCGFPKAPNSMMGTSSSPYNVLVPTLEV